MKRTHRHGGLVARVHKMLGGDDDLVNFERDRERSHFAAELRRRDNWTPKCPACKEPLIARDPSRRFMEDDRYAECRSGHVFELVKVEKA